MRQHRGRLAASRLLPPAQPEGQRRLHASRGCAPGRPQRHRVRRHYAGIFEDVDPAQRVTAEAAIRAAREPGVRRVRTLLDPTPTALG